MPITVRQRSILNKNGAKRSASFNRGKRGRKGSEGDFLITSAPSDLKSISYPGGVVTLILFLIARLSSAYWGQIADCDETYNYWEPLHYLVYGHGLQTWEYSPLYAIRSYAPLWMFAVPAKMLSLVMSPQSVFYMIRAILAVLYASSELILYKAICYELGVHVGRTWVWLALPAAGHFASSAAMLPAAWSAALASAALAAWWRRRYARAVAFTAINALLSWPFTALIGVPIAIDIIFLKKRIVDFVKWSLICLAAILIPTVLIDSWHYGKLVIAPWNIVAYNIFTSHGPELYGVEPWTYYFVNGFLNFNIVWVLALSCPVFLMGSLLLTSRCSPLTLWTSPLWLDLLPLGLWLLVFMLQPHKEERFLYPVYGLIVLCGAVCIDSIQKLTFAVGSSLFGWGSWRGDKKHYLVYTGPVMVIIALISAGAGISRSISLYNNYHGSMTILSHLPSPPEGVQLNVCYGKDWYRSPSSFLLPPGYRIRFIPSEFDGQMPAPYSHLPNATRIVHPYFNDANKGDNTTYISPAKCHYIVDSDLAPHTTVQPHYHKQTSTWDTVASVPILDASKSNNIFRAFYIPILSNKHNVYGNLYLLKNKAIS